MSTAEEPPVCERLEAQDPLPTLPAPDLAQPTLNSAEGRPDRVTERPSEGKSA